MHWEIQSFSQISTVNKKQCTCVTGFDYHAIICVHLFKMFAYHSRFTSSLFLTFFGNSSKLEFYKLSLGRFKAIFKVDNTVISCGLVDALKMHQGDSSNKLSP